MSIRVRFAPSPTGKLHVGNIRTALANVLFARKHEGGVFILRFEDTDVSREVLGAEEKMIADLNWLGMGYDEGPGGKGDYGPYHTRKRAERGDYAKAIEHLRAAGRVYECFVSRDELELMRKSQRMQGLPPHYDGRHRDLSTAQKETFIAQGRKPVLRFKLDESKPIVFQDIVRGECVFEAKNLGGDPVIVRDNGIPLFTFGGVVDDINQRITHVIRGEDHVTNTAIQVQIFEALGAALPTFAHMPMLADKDGAKLSKRLDGLSIAELRTKGFTARAITTYLATLGFGTPLEPADILQLAQQFDLSKMGRSTVRFDMEQLKRMNKTVLTGLSYNEVSEVMAQYVSAELNEAERQALWHVARENIEVLSELKAFVDLCFGERADVVVAAEDAAYIETALQTLPQGTLNAQSWEQWVGTLKAQTGRKGKALFMPLRLALTGQQHGPEMDKILPLIGRERAVMRLQNLRVGEAA